MIIPFTAGCAGTTPTDSDSADLAFEVHQALITAEVKNPRLAKNRKWRALRANVFADFLATFGAV